MTTHMASEIHQIPQLVAKQLAANAPIWETLAAHLRTHPTALIMTVARGSSDHAATFAKYLCEVYLGIPVVSAAPSIYTLYHRPLMLKNTVVIGLSQSGQSPDICAVMQAARAEGALTLALVNQTRSPLASLAEYVVPVHAGEELSVAATKSYVTTLTALIQGVAVLTGNAALLTALQQLPEALEQTLEMDWQPILPALQRATDTLTLARGFGFPIAQEAALKLKETCRLHAEAFSSAEVLHGPFALIRPGYPVLQFLQNDVTLSGNLSLASKIAALGGQVWMAIPAGLAVPPPGCQLLPLPKSLHEVLDPVMAILAFYRMVEQLSRQRGYAPDRPEHLHKVTKTH